MSGPDGTGFTSAPATASTPAGLEAAVLAFEGDLDLAAVEGFDDAVEGADSGAPLVIDMSGVRFIDSSGIHALVRAQTARRSRDLGVAIVVAPGSAVERVLEISGLRDELQPTPDRDSALAALDGDGT